MVFTVKSLLIYFFPRTRTIPLLIHHQFIVLLLCVCVCVCVSECVNVILWGTACNCNIPCGVLFICGVQNMYPTIFCVKLFPKCHLPPIFRSPRNTSQNFFWKCVYFYTLFKLCTPPRAHVYPTRNNIVLHSTP